MQVSMQIIGFASYSIQILLAEQIEKAHYYTSYSIQILLAEQIEKAHYYTCTTYVKVLHYL